jgi:hypothetical protein
MKAADRKKRAKNIDHRIVVIISILILAAATVTAAVLYNRLSYSNIKLSDMLQFKYTGYDGSGEAAATLVSPMEYTDFSKSVKAKLSSSSGLKNGDSITVTWSYDADTARQMKLRIDDTPYTVKVSGLKEPVKISDDELFKNVKITEEGISPYITVTAENIGTDSFLKTVKFTVADAEKFYAAGDTYKVSAAYDSKLASKDGYVMSSDNPEHTYTVSQGDTYITDPAEITQDELSRMNQTASGLFTDKKAREYGLRIFREMNLMPVWSGASTTFRWESPKLISAYFDIRKSDSPDNDIQKHVNDVKLIYNAVLTQANGTSCNAEVIVRFEDIIGRQDGTVDLNLSSGTIISASARNANIKELISNDASDYDVQTLDIQ